MNRINDYNQLKDNISSWLSNYKDTSSSECFVVGVSGGIDSAVSSTLAAETGYPVYAIGTVSYTHLTLPTNREV